MTNKEVVQKYLAINQAVHGIYYSGRSSNMFFEADVMFSYGHHFPLARVAFKNGWASTVLISSLPTSNTTSRHKNIVWYAANRRLLPVYFVPHILGTQKEHHLENFVHLCNTVNDFIYQESKAKHLNVEWFRQMFDTMRLSCYNYAKRFKVNKRLTRAYNLKFWLIAVDDICAKHTSGKVA